MSTEQEVKEQEQMAQQNVTLLLTVEEVNKVLTILGNAPFKDVNGLIQKIYTQGVNQLKDDEAKDEKEKPE